MAHGEVLVDHYLFVGELKVYEGIEGIDMVELAFGMAAKWVDQEKPRQSPDLRLQCHRSIVGVITARLSEVVKHAHELLTCREVNW